MKTANLVSIVCPGHSGSTLLDMVMGTLPGVLSSGEMIYIPWKLHKQKRPEKFKTTFCSCGRTLDACEHWGPVLQEISRELGFQVADFPERFNISIYRPFFYGSSLRKKISVRFFDLAGCLLNPERMINFSACLFKRSIANNWLLFDSACLVAGRDFFVDSSKDVYRHLYLRRHRPGRAKLIVLVRQVYGVVSTSYAAEQGPAALRRKAAAWLRHYNHRIFNVIRHLDQSEYLVLSYEELAVEVNKARRRIAAFLGIDASLEPIEKLYPAGLHIVAGNPVRNSNELEIRLDERWRARLSPARLAELSRFQARLHPVFQTVLSEPPC